MEGSGNDLHANTGSASILAGVMLVLWVSVMVVGVPRRAAGADLIPLTLGNWWTYELSSRPGEYYDWGVVGFAVVAGKTWAKLGWCRPPDCSDTSSITFWRTDASGLFDNKGACQDIDLFCDDIRFAYPVVESSYEFITDCICGDGHADTAHMMVYADTLTVPAGRFSGLMYHGTGYRYGRLLSDWTFFAPGVGLVAEWWSGGGDVDTLRLASFHIDGPTDVRDAQDRAVIDLPVLFQSYPNPFNAGTVIQYTTGRDGYARLEVFDILGRRVTTLVDEFQPAGTREITWDGTGAHGEAVASGMYFYRLTAGSYTESKKMVLLK